MDSKKKPVSLRLPEELLARIDCWREDQDLPVSITYVVQRALEDFLNERGI